MHQDNNTIEATATEIAREIPPRKSGFGLDLRDIAARFNAWRETLTLRQLRLYELVAGGTLIALGLQWQGAVFLALAVGADVNAWLAKGDGGR